MPPASRTHFFTVAKTSALLASVFLGLALLPLAAQEAQKREPSEKVYERLPEIGRKIKEQPIDLDGALEDINALLATAKPESFDVAYLSQLKGQVYLSKQDYISSIPPIETAYRLSRAHNYFDPQPELELLWTLAQLQGNDAGSERNPEIQKNKYSRALSSIREWLSRSPKPTFEAHMFAAVILYQQATGGTTGASGASKEPDKELLRQSEAECQKALTTARNPRESIYTLLVAIAQSLGDMEMMARYLEIIVAANPKSGQYWPTLVGSYLQIAEPIPEGSFLKNAAYAKAIYTMQRAQKNGFMNTPADYLRIAYCFFNSGQYEGTIDILEDGLRSGKIDNEYSKWEFLAQCYTLLGQTQKVIDTFAEAMKRFPDKGEIDMQIGNIYYTSEQYAKALEYMQSALKKGVSEGKQHSVLLFFIGYLHFELKELDKALDFVTQSLKLQPDNSNARELLRAINEAINERERILQLSQPAGAQKTQPAAAPQPAATSPPAAAATTTQPAQ